MLTYPPDKHETDSKQIFFIGSAEKYCKINNRVVELQHNKNFCHIVPLKLGDNKFKCDIDGEIFERTIYGVAAEVCNPISYAEHYEAFPASKPSKANTLRSIIVSENKIRIPLNTAPFYTLDQKGKYKCFLDLHDIEMDLDWIKYLSDECPVIIGEVINSKIPIIFKRPVSLIVENWEDNSLVLEIKYHTHDQVVCLDPGHGGSQTGSISPKGIAEKTLNLEMSLAIKEHLEKLGVETVLTRNEDIDLDLASRVEKAKESNCNIFLSIHHNALPDGRNPSEEKGASCHYFHEQSKVFADYLLSKITEFTDLDFAGFYRQNLHVLRENTDCISALIELGFLIHPLESDLIASKEFREKTSLVIAKAIYNFINT